MKVKVRVRQHTKQEKSTNMYTQYVAAQHPAAKNQPRPNYTTHELQHKDKLVDLLDKIAPEKWKESKIQYCTDCKTIVTTKKFPKHNLKHTRQDRLVTAENKNACSTTTEIAQTYEHKERLPTPEEIAQHERLYTYIPKRTWPAVQQAVRPVLQSYLHATNIEHKERAAILFHYNFRYILQRPSRGGKGKHAASVHMQIRQNLTHIQSLYMHAHPTQKDQPSNNKQQNTESKLSAQGNSANRQSHGTA